MVKTKFKAGDRVTLINGNGWGTSDNARIIYLTNRVYIITKVPTRKDFQGDYVYHLCTEDGEAEGTWSEVNIVHHISEKIKLLGESDE